MNYLQRTYSVNAGTLMLLVRARREAWIFFSTSLLVAVLISADLIHDQSVMSDGRLTTGSIFELALGLLAFGQSAVLGFRAWRLNSEIAIHRALTENAEKQKSRALIEASQWQRDSSRSVEGLRDAIDAQLNRWDLTQAEKELALLLLKGLSLKQMAEVKGVTEKIAREQTLSVFAKAGLPGRSEFSAYFLEDIMLPAIEIAEGNGEPAKAAAQL